MMTKISCFFIAVMASVTLVGQDSLRINSQGPLLPQFLESSTSKFEKQIDASEEERAEMSRRERMANRDFQLQSNFIIDRFFFDGEVYNNDFISNYLNSIVDHLLEDDQHTRHQIKIFVSKNPAVNAFATEQGIIVVNIGLLGRVRSEAELAFILAHEIIHFKNHHATEALNRNTKIEKKLGSFRKMSTQDRRLSKHSFKRAQEMEADMEGLDIYRKSGYDLMASFKVFEVLDSAHLPALEIKVNLEELASGLIRLPAKLDSIEIKEIKFEEYDEDFASHPSVNERRDSVSARIGTNPSRGKLAIVSEDTFKQSRALCRRETLKQYCRLGYFDRAIMQYYMLAKSGNTDEELDRYLAYSLYGEATVKNHHLNNNGMSSIGGTGELLTTVIDRFSSLEISTLALAVIESLGVKYPDENYYNKLNEELQYALGYHQTLTMEEIDPFSDELATWVTTYLATQVSDSSFVAHMEEGFADRKLDDEHDAQSEKEKFKIEMDRQKELNKLFRKGIEIPDAKSVVVLNPFFISLDERERTFVDYLESEKREEFVLGAIEEIAGKNDVEVHLLDTKSMSEADVDAYADMQLFHEWMDMSRTLSDVQFLPPNHDEVMDKMKEYGSKYVLYTGFFSVTYNIRGKGYAAALTIGVAPQFIPHLWYRIFKPRNSTFFAYMLVDPEQNEIVLSELREHNGLAPRESLIRNDIFHLFNLLGNE